jgi:putative membrane protein
MRTWLWRGGVAALVAAFAATAGAQDRKDDEKPLTDAEFVKKAYSGNLHEIELGKIAKERAADPDVKKFAERMITDHTKANDELKEAAREANIPVPEKMEAEHQDHVNKFRDHRGEDFDRVYMRHMVEGHEKTLNLYTRAAREVQNERLKAYVEKTIPTVKQHLEQARKISERLDRK